MVIILAKYKNGQSSNKHTRLIKGEYSVWTEEVTWYVTCWHYGSLAPQKSYAFGKTMKKCSIDSTPRVEMSCTKVTCRSHGVRSRAGVRSCAGGMQVARGDLYLQMGGVIIVQTLWIKCRYQLVVKLKANKCYQELLCYLSSYINNVTTSGFLLIVSLTISLWLLWPYCWPYCFDCSDCIANHIVLIVLLQSYYWLQRFNCSNRIVWSHCFNCIALAILLIALLWLYCSDRIICIISPQSPSGPKRNLPPWWIMHLHLIIQQDPSAYIKLLNYLELRLDLLP